MILQLDSAVRVVIKVNNMPYIKAKQLQYPHELIVLVHGLLRSHRNMYLLGRFLAANGYDVFNYDYASTRFNIKQHGTDLKNVIETIFKTHPDKKIHFITHSLGGIITREALSLLNKSDLNKIGKVIMLAPPTQGSAYARFFATHFPTVSNYIKPIAELSDAPNAYIHQVPVPENIKIHIIAGRYDTIVPPATTALKNQPDILIVNINHTFIMNHAGAREAMLELLQN